MAMTNTTRAAGGGGRRMDLAMMEWCGPDMVSGSRFWEQLGFSLHVGSRGLGLPAVPGLVLTQGTARVLVLSAPLPRIATKARFAQVHGAGICGLMISVDDVEDAYAAALKGGALPATPSTGTGTEKWARVLAHPSRPGTVPAEKRRWPTLATRCGCA